MLESLRKLDPRLAVANPVMFVVWCGTVLCLLLTLDPRLLDAQAAARERGFNGLISLTLLATLLFANFAEALAEGRGKAQADALRRTQARTQARRQQSDGSIDLVDSSDLRRGDLVVAVAEQPVPDPAALLQQVERSAVGEPLALTVIRGQRELSVSIRPAALPQAG